MKNRTSDELYFNDANFNRVVHYLELMLRDGYTVRQLLGAVNIADCMNHGNIIPYKPMIIDNQPMPDSAFEKYMSYCREQIALRFSAFKHPSNLAVMQDDFDVREPAIDKILSTEEICALDITSDLIAQDPGAPKI